VSPIWDTQGNLIAIRWLLNDVTQQTQAHQELRRAKEELETRIAQQNRALRKANARLKNEIADREKASEKINAYSLALEQVNQDLQNFASIASHDMQEPLRKIQQFGENLRLTYGPVLDEKGLDMLGRMLNATSRMQAMLADLLAFSTITTQVQPIVKVDLGQEVQRVVTDLDHLVERTQGQIDLGNLPVIEADPSQMRHLFQNLIQNALKFHRPGVSPVVSITAELPSSEAVQIKVNDNGIGLDEKNKETIFHPFRRLQGRNEFEGNGMGLAICRRIVERHFGTITVESCPGLGSTFIVTLPIHQAAAPPDP
jgi:light-regulated signal transduction histidine kinase (bacteriophytochrome)